MIEELLAVVAAVLVVLLPGASVGYAIGLRRLALIGLSGPIGVALCAVLAVLGAPLGVPFGWWHSFVVAGIALGIRLALRSRRLDPPLGPRDLAVLAAIAVSGVAAAIVAFRGLALDAVNSTYDGVFHLNAVAYILGTGNGSSIELYRMAHPGNDPIEFYPAAWHDLVAATVQLTGASVPLATNATWIAVTAAVWIPGVVYLAVTAFGRGGQLLTALLAAPLATAFAAAPYLLLDWGTLFPTGLAYALLPAGLA
ncbi:MAG: hypothetical protein M3116_00100, partial [Actinomycetota bacterium]|nr:hypothetical protein [Actinomycetota bacterium]